MNQEQKQTFTALLQGRQAVYSVFHRVYGREPDEELLDLLTSPDTRETFLLFSEEEGDVFAKCALFLDEVKESRKDKEFLSQVHTEYMRLFVGPTKLVAPPWESVYRSKQAMLFQESTLAVRQFYKKFGMQPESLLKVPDDSLGLEMAFMMNLCGKALEALEADDEKLLKHILEGQRIFLDSHLLEWIPKFFQKMEDTPSDHLYPQMTLVLNAFVKRDRDLTAEMLAM